MPPSTLPSLTDLEYLPYLDDEGQLIDRPFGIGVYAIFDASKTLQYIGYSRDVTLSLKQHLVRQPQKCYWLKVQTIERPSRTLLEEIRTHWIGESGTTPPGNAAEELLWSQAIDAKAQMTTAEQSAYAASDDLERTKLLKQIARRVEAEVMIQLEQRGVKMPVRFDPKLKEEGLLSLKNQ
ncbi:GIY-YIG nuclease family protein [Leptolyngbya ohadii]|uniref:GIY-YIG nuclease family protein n=1 Tax=Leptolyngbya ohadii TaxID=1962290 RepID=UPI000B599064|nr:GIY-YIG nuclease family protein [Leptolyngbya ohadii]